MSTNLTSAAQLNARFRKWVYDLIFNDQIKSNLHLQFEHFITYVIVLNMAGLVLEHIPIIYDTRQNIFHFFAHFFTHFSSHLWNHIKMKHFLF